MIKKSFHVSTVVVFCILFLSNTVSARREFEISGGIYLPEESSLQSSAFYYASYSFPIHEPIMLQVAISADKFRPTSDYNNYDNKGTNFESTYRYSAEILGHLVYPIASSEDISLNFGLMVSNTNLKYLIDNSQKNENEFVPGLTAGSNLRIWITDSAAVKLGGKYKLLFSEADEGGFIISAGLIFR